MGHTPIDASQRDQDTYGEAFTPKPSNVIGLWGKGSGPSCSRMSTAPRRAAMEELAVRSHQLAHRAAKDGDFARELVTVAGVERRGHKTTPEATGGAEARFKPDGRITAGTSR